MVLNMKHGATRATKENTCVETTHGTPPLVTLGSDKAGLLSNQILRGKTRMEPLILEVPNRTSFTDMSTMLFNDDAALFQTTLRTRPIRRFATRKECRACFSTSLALPPIMSNRFVSSHILLLTTSPRSFVEKSEALNSTKSNPVPGCYVITFGVFGAP